MLKLPTFIPFQVGRLKNRHINVAIIEQLVSAASMECQHSCFTKRLCLVFIPWPGAFPVKGYAKKTDFHYYFLQVMLPLSGEETDSAAVAG